MCPDRLTPKQEAFAQAVASGLNQTAAYRLAGYSVNKMLLATVYESACRLARDHKVTARIEELQQATRQDLTWSRERLVAEVHRLATEPGTKPADRIRAYDLISKCLGLQVSRQQTETRSHLTVEHAISTLTTELLLRLAEASNRLPVAGFSEAPAVLAPDHSADSDVGGGGASG